jgi:hypothetical protein
VYPTYSDAYAVSLVPRKWTHHRRNRDRVVAVPSQRSVAMPLTGSEVP